MTRVGDGTGVLQLEPEDTAFEALDAEAGRLARLRARASTRDSLVRLVEMPGATDHAFEQSATSKHRAADAGAERQHERIAATSRRADPHLGRHRHVG